MASRLLFGLLVLLAAAVRLDAAGFAMNDNFTVLTPPWPNDKEANQFAQEVLESAEQWRTKIATEWLGYELPPGLGQTTVNVAFDPDRDDGLTWTKNDPQRRFHTLYMTTTPEQALGSTLAHEMTHVVLATRFPSDKRLAPWLETGIASCYDNQARQQMRKKQLAYFLHTGNFPSIESILNTRDIGARNHPELAVAASLTSFLLSRDPDKPTFLKFGQHAKQAGWDAALRKFYRINNVPQLDTQWRQWLSQADAGVQYGQ